MEKLAALFGGIAFVRTTRLFLLHPTTAYDTKTLRDKTKLGTDELRPVIRDLLKATVIKKRGAKLILNDACSFLAPLRALLIGEMLTDVNLTQRMQGCGTLKLLVASGVFLDDNESRTDILVVADKLNQRTLKKVINALEADVGKEVRYTAFTPLEFNYRMSVNDKLVRDILDYPHEKLVNKLITV